MITVKKYEHGGYHEPPDGFTLEDYIRQMYAESRFNPKAGSPVGAAGLAQIMPSTREYMIGRYNLPKTIDVYNPQDARTMQRKYMEDLYSREWNTGTDENKKLKALAAYNYGPTNVIRALEKAKKQGYDIYNDTSWTKDKKVLPKETRDYLERTYFGTDKAFEREYSSAHDKYFDIFPEDRPQPKADLKEMPVIEPKLDPRLQQAFKIMGFKGYKNGGVTVKKYEHGGSHPTAEEKKQQMLATGRWTEGPNGELVRVPQQDMFGFPTTERVRELSQSTEPLNQQQLREYIRYGFSPTNPVNTAFSMIAGAHPAGAAADVVGNVIGKGLGAVARGGKQVMNFLRPKADEAAELAVQRLGMRQSEMPEFMALSDYEKTKYLQDIIDRPQSDFQGGLDEVTNLLKQRKAEIASPEGQRRLRNQIVDDIQYFQGLASQSDEALKKMGMNADQINHLRGMDWALKTRGEEGYIKAVMTTENARIQKIMDISHDENFQWIVEAEDELKEFAKNRLAASRAGDFEEVNRLDAEIKSLTDYVEVRYNQMANQSMNAFYDPSSDALSVGRAYLRNPEVARTSAAHEFQHGMLSDAPFQRVYMDPATGNTVGFPRTTEADRILHEELDLLDGNMIADLPIDKDQQMNLFGDLEYMKTKAFDFRGLPTGRGGTGSEMTPYLSELREALVDEGVMSGRHARTTPEQIQEYLHQYRLREPSYGSGYPYIPGMDPESVRIIEVLNPASDAKNAKALSKALNKMLVAVPAVGAAGVAAGTTAEGGSTYYKGGKLNLKKSAACGMRVAKK